MEHAPGAPSADEAQDVDVNAERGAGGAESTGVESVDRVLAEVAAVTDVPVAEHVQVFERAHEQLRRALDAPAPRDGQQGA
jgi:hypothetical protein